MEYSKVIFLKIYFSSVCVVFGMFIPYKCKVVIDMLQLKGAILLFVFLLSLVLVSLILFFYILVVT